MSIRSKIFKWLTHGQMQVNEPSIEKYPSVVSMVGQPVRANNTIDSEVTLDQPSITLRFIKASNGNVIEVTSTAKHKHGHYDRTIEVYVVNQDQKLSEAIVQILAAKALER